MLDDKEDDELVFEQLSFQQWLRHNKFAYYTLMPARLTETEEMREQHGDIIQWDQSNGVYILTHDVSGVEWSKDRNLLPKNVYEVYVQYWKNVDLNIS